MMNQRAKVSSERPTTAGTKMRAMRSTVRCTGALEPWASCTIRIMLASTVCLPTASARMERLPSLTMVPARRRSPFCFSTGAASPVIMLSSIFATGEPSHTVPSHAVPSTGIFSPGRTSRMSPFCTAEMGMSTGEPSTTAWAVFGCRLISERMAEAVLCLARSSKSRPVSTKVMIMTEASK